MGWYRIYTNDTDKVVVASTYAGKVVRGTAKCNPEDKFDYDFGVELARLRCDRKIAKKRYKRALAKQAEAVTQLVNADGYLAKMNAYLADADAYLTDVEAKYNSVLNKHFFK